MTGLEARQVKIPFKGVTPKSPPVPVWVLPERRVLACGSTAHTLVPWIPFVKSVLPDLDVHDLPGVPGGRHTYRKEFPHLAGTDGEDGPLLSWRQLSWFGWRQSCMDAKAIVPELPVPPGGNSSRSSVNRYAYWTIFFAQNIMRGLLTRLVETEMQAIEQDAEGEVFWQPLVAGMQHEIRAYDNIPPVRRVSLFAEREVKDMWQRVLGRVSERNRANLEHCLASRKGDVRKIGER